MNESRLKSSLLTTASVNLKPSVLLTSTLNTGLNPSLLLSSSSAALKTTFSLTRDSSHKYHQNHHTNPLNESIGYFSSASNDRKKKSDLAPSLETKKLKILAEPKVDLLLTKPVLSHLSNTIDNKSNYLGGSKLLHTKSDLINLRDKPVVNKLNSKPTPDFELALKRQHSDQSTNIEEIDFYVPDSFVATVETQISPAPQPAKRLRTNQPIRVENLSTTSLNQKSQLIVAKNGLVNAVSSSLIREPNFKNAQDPTRSTILRLAEFVAKNDPEFVLKLALYTRRELNIRVTANFLLCLASFREECRPHLNRFFKHSILLPSDWIDVAEQYQLFTDKRINFGSLPSALRKSMVEKFPDFDQYQLAKYNKEKSRSAKNSKIRDVKHVKAKLKENDEDAGDEKVIEDKFIKNLKKGLAINDRILIEVVVKEDCKNLKIDIIKREELKPVLARRAPRKPVPIKTKKESTDLIAVRINLDYERHRIVQKSLITKEWSKRTDVVSNPKGFKFVRSFDSVFLFVDLKPSEFVFGVIENNKEHTLCSYAHSRHNITLCLLNCIRISGVGIKLKDLTVASKDVIHMDSQPGDENELKQRSFTLKQLIRQLHISSPAENVMSLIGKKYPGTFEEFVRMKLPGIFDSDRAGKRMKLPTPETWETQISLNGNKAEVWEKLIDNKKLPYMAMLRNIRNMIKCGISEKHHQWVIKKLQDEGAVIHSKQFPFRFFTAYSVLDELEEEFNEYMKWSQTGEVQQPTRGRGNKSRKAKTTFKDMNYDLDILKRYRTALDNALKVATTFNVSPIKGSTLILLDLNMNRDATQIGKSLGRRVTSVSEIGALLALMFKYSCENSTLVAYSGGVVYENFQLSDQTILDNMKSLVDVRNMRMSNDSGCYPKRVLTEILDQKSLFDNMVVISGGISDVSFQQQFLRKYRANVNESLMFVSVNLATDECKVVRNEDFDHENDICISGFSDSILRFVAERGNQAQLTHIENIEKVYDIPPPKHETNKSAIDLKTFENKVNIVERPRFKQFVPLTEWRTVKVFISSTFRDMHSERDLLAKMVFPLLRSKLSKYSINVYDIDLRWGITESDGNQTLDLCLNQVLESDYFLGILGERYGQVVADYSVRKNPALEWLNSYSPGASITELEIETKLRRADETSNQKLKTAFFYFRDPRFIHDVPFELRDHFQEESIETKLKLSRLKNRLRSASLEIFDGYKCEWLQLDSSNRALVSGLESFGVRVFNNLYNSITREYQENIQIVELDENIHLNGLTDVYVKCAAEGFIGRENAIKKFEKLVDETKYVQTYSSSSEAIHAMAKEKNSIVNMILLTGEAGCGKTAFICNVGPQLTTQLNEIFIHCAGAYPNSEYITLLLKRFSIKTNRQFGLGLDEVQIVDSNEFDFQKKIFAEVLEKLDQFLTERKLYFIIDGVDELMDDHGHVDNSFSWLPERIPPKIVFIFTARSSSPTKMALSKIASSNKLVNTVRVVNFELEQFDIMDKSEFVRAQLAKFNKYLDENPFNNQMKLLTGKRESSDPLYLTLACEELRLHGHFETLNAKIKELPIKLNKLIEFVLDRLEADFGEEFFNLGFLFICCARDGLHEHELRSLLDMYFGMKNSNCLEAIENCESFLGLDNDLVGKIIAAKKHVKTEKFLGFVESISSTFLKPRSGKNSNLVTLKKNVIIENALRARFGSFNNTRPFKPSIKLVNRIMAFFYWTQVDPKLNKKWTRSNLRSFTYLPLYLVISELKNDAMSVICDLLFLSVKCENGQAGELADDFDFHENWKSKSLFGERNVFAKKLTTSKPKTTPMNESELAQNFASYKHFLMSNIHLLVSNPRLLFQQAMNEPDSSVVAKDLRQLLRTNPDISGCNILEWVNKSTQVAEFSFSPTRIDDFDDAVSCVTISPDSSLVACGTDNCQIKIFSMTTAKFLRKLHGHAGRINSIVFIDPKTLCSASSDGLACLWNTTEGYRIKVINKHNNHVVSDCCAEKNGKSLITVGWDCTAKIWSSEGNLLGELKHPKPINCISFNPDGNQVATGCWDSCIRIFNYFDRARKAVLRGHKASVRSISFSNNGIYIGSSSIDGEVKLWNSRNGAQVATLKGHSLPVNSIRFSPRNQFLITGSSDRTVKVWPGSVGKMIRRVDGDEKHPDPVTSVCFEQLKGEMFASGSHSGEVRLYEVYGGVLISKKRVHEAIVRRLKFSHCGEYILTGSEDGSAKIVNVSDSSLTVIAELCPSNSPMPVTALDVNKHNLIVTGSEDCSVYIYSDVIEKHQNDSNVKITKCTPSIRLSSHKSPVTACGFNQAGNKFATASKDSTVIVWEYIYSSETVKELFVINRGHSDWITDLAWSPTSDFILTSSNDLTLKIWSSTDGAEKSKLIGHTSTINSCSFKYGCAVSASLDGTIKIWSHRGHEITTLYGHKSKVNSCDLFVKIRQNMNLEVEKDTEPMELGLLWADQVEMEAIKEKKKSMEATRNAFNIEDVYLVSGSDDSSVRIWKPIESNYLASLENHNDRISSVDLSREDVVASASNDRTVTLTNLKEFFDHHESVLESERVVRGHLSEITCLTVNESNDILISGSMDGMVYIWKIDTASNGLNFITDFKAHDRSCVSVCVIGDQTEGVKSLKFATCSSDEPIKIWKLIENPNTRPTIQLANTLVKKSNGKYKFLGRIDTMGQKYLVAVDLHNDRFVVVFYNIVNDNFKLISSNFVVLTQMWLFSNIRLIDGLLYINLLRNEILEIDLLDFLKKNTSQVVILENSQLKDVQRLNRLKTLDIDSNRSVSNETWFTAVNKTRDSVFTGDWKGNVYKKQSDGTLKFIKKLGHSQTTEICSFRVYGSDENRLVSFDKEGLVRIWSENFDTQIGMFKNTSEITRVIVLADPNNSRISLVFGDKTGNLNLLNWYE